MDSTNTDTSGTAVFSDDELPARFTAPAATRRRWPWVVGIAAIAAAAVTAGVLLVGSTGSAPAGMASTGTASGGTVPAASASPAAEPSRAASVSPSAQPGVLPSSQASEGAGTATTAGRYVSASAGVSFDLPDGWTAEESTVQPAGHQGTRIVVFNEARMQAAELYHGTAGGVGGACGPGPYKMTELDTAPALNQPWATAAGVRFSYRVLDMRADGGGFDYQIGLVDNASGELRDTCLMYSVVGGAPQGTLSFANRAAQSPRHDDPIFNSMAEAKNYLLTAEYRKLKAMILSLDMQN